MGQHGSHGLSIKGFTKGRKDEVKGPRGLPAWCQGQLDFDIFPNPLCLNYLTRCSTLHSCLSSTRPSRWSRTRTPSSTWLARWLRASQTSVSISQGEHVILHDNLYNVKFFFGILGWIMHHQEMLSLWCLKVHPRHLQWLWSRHKEECGSGPWHIGYQGNKAIKAGWVLTPVLRKTWS